MALKTKSLRRLCLKWLNVRNQLHRSFSQNTTELKLKQQSHFHEANLGNRLTRKLWASRLYSRVHKKRQFYWLKPVLQCIKDDSASMRPNRRLQSILILILTFKIVTPEYHFRVSHIAWDDQLDSCLPSSENESNEKVTLRVKILKSNSLNQPYIVKLQASSVRQVCESTSTIQS